MKTELCMSEAIWAFATIIISSTETVMTAYPSALKAIRAILLTL